MVERAVITHPPVGTPDASLARMDSGRFECRVATESDWTTSVIVSAPEPAPAPSKWLPANLAAIVREVLQATTLHAAVTAFEHELTRALNVTDVLCVWMDWPRRIGWSVRGRVSARLQELAPEVAGSGRRVILDNAIVEPIGPAPSRAVLVLKGPSDHLFHPQTLRHLPRIATRIAPTLERLLADHDRSIR